MKKLLLALGLGLCVVCVGAFNQVLGQKAMSLKVKVSYAGEGEVGGTAGIHVSLFDTPNFNDVAIPIGWKSAYENGEVLTFYGLSNSPIYMVAGYGDYSLMGPPPSGTPVAMYKVGEPSPTPIELTEDVVEVHFIFDDSSRMP